MNTKALYNLTYGVYLMSAKDGGKEDFGKIGGEAAPKVEEVKLEPTVGGSKKFVCSVCGYVHEGDTPPERCPLCQVPASYFNEVQE